MKTTVTDQKSVVTSYTYKAVADGSDYNVESRQYVSSGTPDGGDRDLITTANGLGQAVSVVTKATAGGTQTSKVTRQYKFCGALWKETQQIGDANGDSRTVEYGFDSCGKVTKLYWPHTGTAGDYVAYSDFDGLNRPRTYSNNISGNGTDLAKYTFLGARPATKDYYDGATRIVAQTFWSASGGGTNNYDHYARLIKSHAVGDPDGTPADAMKVSYAFDDASNPIWRYDELSNAAPRKWSQKYQYDVMDRLTKAQQGVVGGTWPSSPSLTADKTWVWDGTVGEETYTLDKVGNWDKFYNDGTDDDRSHNAVNEITGRTIGGQTKNPTWDNTGNLTDDGENYKYVYDFRNRLVQAKRRGDNSLLAEYAYDGLNRRIRKVVYDTDGETEPSDTRYIYNGWRCIEERDENDSHELRARYVYGGLYIDEPLRMYRDTNSDGDFADGGDVNAYYLQDRLFNVVALTDTNGAIVERTWYEPYGKPTNRRESDGDETTASHFGNPMLFCGYRLDGETSSFDVRNRQYQPIFGRWMQRDPAGYSEGPHLMQYVLGRPCSFVDPFGLMTGKELLNEVLKRLKWNYTTENGVHQFTITAKGEIVPGCPSECPCVDVEVSGTYARKLEKDPPSPLMAKMSGLAVYNVETWQGIYLVGGPNAQEIARKMYWSDPQVVAQHKLAEAALTAVKPLVGGVLKEMWKNRNLSVSISAKGRICWDGKKLRSSFCKADIAGAFNVGSTTKAPIEKVSVSMGASIEARGTVDLCEGTIGGSLSGVFEILIDLPGSWSVTGITIPLGEIPFPTLQNDALKVLTPGQVAKCAK